MTTQITINPYATTVGNAGLFNTASLGLRQGTAYPDPATRFALRTGILATTETLPMWGGVGIYEFVPTSIQLPPGLANPSYALGVIVGRATSLTGATALRGFSVFDQAYGMVTSPQSPVPLIGSGGNVMSYALGSRARIAVACDPILASLAGGDIGANVSWDFVNQLLIPFAGTFTISSGTYVSATGIVTLTLTGAVTFSPGDAIIVSSLGGTGAFASLNGTYTAIAPTSGTTVTYQAATGLGSATISSGSLTLGSGASSALPVKVLDVVVNNCETVVFNSVTGFATWNYNGACAVIQI